MRTARALATGPSQTLGLTDHRRSSSAASSPPAPPTPATGSGGRTGAPANFSNTNFRVRITPVGSPCTDSFDSVSVKVVYDAQTPAVVGPDGESLVQQGVWATALSQGADIVNGDIYSPEDNGSGTNTEYAPTSYYDYAVELEPGTTNGSVYIFDPVFCATNNDGSQGMGDRWFGSGGMSTFYDLWDTNNTPYDFTDDTWIAGNTGPSALADKPAVQSLPQEQSDRPEPGRTEHKSVRSTSCELGTDDGSQRTARTGTTAGGRSRLASPARSTRRRGSTGSASPRQTWRLRPTRATWTPRTAFSIFANVSGHTCPSTPIDPSCPRVYGLGTMEAFTPLEPNNSADLYLSQIKCRVRREDAQDLALGPGRHRTTCGPISRSCMPTATGYTNANFTWTATRFSTSGSASNCNGSSDHPRALGPHEQRRIVDELELQRVLAHHQHPDPARPTPRRRRRASPDRAGGRSATPWDTGTGQRLRPDDLEDAADRQSRPPRGAVATREPAADDAGASIRTDAIGRTAATRSVFMSGRAIRPDHDALPPDDRVRCTGPLGYAAAHQFKGQ